MKEVINILS